MYIRIFVSIQILYNLTHYVAFGRTDTKVKGTGAEETNRTLQAREDGQFMPLLRMVLILNLVSLDCG